MQPLQTLCRRMRRQPRGTTAVEFAFVAPVLILIVVATLELWRVHMFVHTANQAAYKAARSSVVPGATAAEVEQVAQSVMQSVGALATEVDLDPPVIDNNVPNVTVTVRIPMSSNGWIAARFFHASHIVAQSTMTRETAQH